MEGPRILITCFEPPSYGGASTSGYQLFKQLGGVLPVQYLSLVEQETATLMSDVTGIHTRDPIDLADTHKFILKFPTYKHQPGLREYVDALSPSLILAIGYIAGYVVKSLRPDLPLILMTTGCQQLKDRMISGDFATAEEFLLSGASFTISNNIEKSTFEMADHIVTHSELINRLCRIYFPEQSSKIMRRILWFYDWIYPYASRVTGPMISFEDRDIDLLFVASDWSRTEKNYPFVKTISQKFATSSVHVVGRTEKTLPDVTHHNLLSNDDVIGLMARSKVLVCPSSFDAAPGILFEGAAAGCNLVASRNCGNSVICHPNLLVNDYGAQSFIEKITMALRQPHASNTQFFSNQQSLQRLLDLLKIYSLDMGAISVESTV